VIALRREIGREVQSLLKLGQHVSPSIRGLLSGQHFPVRFGLLQSSRVDQIGRSIIRIHAVIQVPGIKPKRIRTEELPRLGIVVPLTHKIQPVRFSHYTGATDELEGIRHYLSAPYQVAEWRIAVSIDVAPRRIG